MNRIGFLIVTAGRPAQLGRCLDSVLPFNLPAGVVVDGIDPETTAVIEKRRARYPGLRVRIFDKRVGKSRARNEGMSLLDTEYVYCVDDDVTVPASSVKALAGVIDACPDVAAVGGPNISPEGSSRFQRVSGYLLASPFVAGAMARRYAPRGAQGFCDDRSIALCNMAVRRSLFPEQGFRFSEDLFYNEENLLLQQMRRKGYRFVYHPGMAVYHERRDSLSSFVMQVMQSGRGRAIMTCKMPASLTSAVYLLPPLALAGVAAALIAEPPLLAAAALLYAALSAGFAFRTARANHEGPAAFLQLALLPVLLHAAYGAGFIAALAGRCAGSVIRRRAPQIAAPGGRTQP